MKPRPKEQTLCHSSFSAGIICGPHRGSFAVRDHLRSNLGIISGLRIICGRGSFAPLYTSSVIELAYFTHYLIQGGREGEYDRRLQN